MEKINFSHIDYLIDLMGLSNDPETMAERKLMEELDNAAQNYFGIIDQLKEAMGKMSFELAEANKAQAALVEMESELTLPLRKDFIDLLPHTLAGLTPEGSFEPLYSLDVQNQIRNGSFPCDEFHTVILLESDLYDVFWGDYDGVWSKNKMSTPFHLKMIDHILIVTDGLDQNIIYCSKYTDGVDIDSIISAIDEHVKKFTFVPRKANIMNVRKEQAVFWNKEDCGL